MGSSPSIPIDLMGRLGNLTNYVGHIVYNGISVSTGNGMNFYITSKLGRIRKDSYLIARKIIIENGEFVIKKKPTLPVYETGSCLISTVPFDTRYPIRWK